MSRKTTILILCFATIFAIFYNRITIVNEHKNIATAIFEQSHVNPQNYIQGINLHKPVGIYIAREGETFIQYQVPNAPQGDFYGLDGSSPSELGINEYGIDPKTKEKVKKEIRVYQVVKETEMLSSFAAPMIDDWSTPQDEARTDGSELQFFSACKECFQRIN